MDLGHWEERQAVIAVEAAQLEGILTIPAYAGGRFSAVVAARTARDPGTPRGCRCT